MKIQNIFLIFALLSIVSYSAILSLGQNKQILTISPISTVSNKIENQVIFKFGKISVPKSFWFLGLNGFAYKQMINLYPRYVNFPVNSCAYTVYGPSRIYTFQLKDSKGQIVKVLSSVQNNEQDSGQSTPETVQEQTKAKILAFDANKEENITNQNSGFNVVKVSRAYEIPRIALAVKNVILVNWRQIRSSPLVKCLQKWQKGVYQFRLYFHGVTNCFEYTHFSNYQSDASQLQGQAQNIIDNSPKVTFQVSIKSQPEIPAVKSEPKVEEQYLSRTNPIFTVTTLDKYNTYTLAEFKKHPGYPTIIKQCNQHFGSFDEKWISRIQFKFDSGSKIWYFQIIVKFVPFLVQVDLQAHYYGSADKASLLQIDQRVFSGKNSQQYFNNWTQIKNFSSYKAFRQTNEYILSQFTYLRFYKVIAAYTQLYKNGRYVRLVYQSQNNYFTFTPNGQNQFNILVYICDGKFYIDRDDFKATNTYSLATDWVSMFVNVNNVKGDKNYDKLVNYFIKDHLDFWNSYKIDQLKVKDNLYVIKFKNSTPIAKVQECQKYAIVQVTQVKVKLLNHFRWTFVNEKSVLRSKVISYVQSKYTKVVPLFSHSKTTVYGKHYQVSYLNEKNILSNIYLRFVDNQELFVQDQWQGIAYQINFDEIPLPENPQQSLIKFILNQDKKTIAVVQVKNVTKNTYQCISLIEGKRWKINVNWNKGVWIIATKQVLLDGYFFVTGYPSINIASCTGYLAKLYPRSFNSKWIYSSIEVKNIGYFIYNRIIFKLNSKSYQGIVRTTYGLQNSHTLISWDPISFIVQKQDYGYGSNYNSLIYGSNSRFFFDYDYSKIFISSNVLPLSKTQIKIQLPVKVQVNVTIDHNALCSYWFNQKCISCIGDYFAENGKCVKIQQECQFWSQNGKCQRCCYGYIVNNQGKCQIKSKH